MDPIHISYMAIEYSGNDVICRQLHEVDLRSIELMIFVWFFDYNTVKCRHM